MDHLRFRFIIPKRSTPTNPTHEALDDIVRESLAIVLPATVISVWVWAAYVVLFATSLTAAAYGALAIVSISSFGAHQLAPARLRAAVAIFLSGLFATVTLLVWTIGTANAVMLYVPFVVVVAILSSMPVTIASAAACALLAWLYGLQAGQTMDAALLPAILIALTALTTLVSSRRLYTALGWALNMTDQARRSAEEAQANRAELRRVLQTLDIAYERLERANRALIFAQEAAEKAYRFKSEFVANVSHELRTPLNLIVGFSEMMATAPESYGGVALPRAYRGDMLATYRNACHLLDLINDVLDLSQLEAGQLPITRQRLDLNDVIREAGGMVQGLADARRLTLQIALPDEPLFLLMDRTRIRQVLLNLLTNAMRYTDQGFVRIEVSADSNQAADEPGGKTANQPAGWAGPGDTFVTVAVRDSGRGIDPANLHRAFEAFSRMDEEQNCDGSGLGLAISKKFIELHSGRIWIESQLGQGTCVSFALPLPETRSLPRATTRLNRPLPALDTPAHVLVLHDDPRTVSILRRHVADCRFQLADGSTALQHAVQELPDVILQDLAWSDALAAAGDLLGATPHFTLPDHIPQIVCPLPSMRHLGLLMGADDYLPKPVTRDDLASALARLPHPPKTALLVDDDPHVVRLLGRMLLTIAPELHFYEAFNGQEALQIARGQRPDVIFLDLNMPQMGGRAVIENLLADRAAKPDFEHIPIIVVSVRNMEEENAPLQGDIVIRRPAGFTLTELLNLLNAVLRCLTRPEAVSPTSAAARLQESPG